MFVLNGNKTETEELQLLQEVALKTRRQLERQCPDTVYWVKGCAGEAARREKPRAGHTVGSPNFTAPITSS